MYNHKIILLFGGILALCNSAAIYKKFIKKCELGDSECEKLLFESIFEEVTENGIPEFNIPKIDPYEAKDLEMIALGMIKITMKDGAIAGFKSCKNTSFMTDVKTLHTNIEMVCDLFSYEGHYKAESTPTLLALMGDIKIHGDGKAKVIVENIKVNLDLPFEFKKLDDGELHFRLLPEDVSSSFEVLGKTTIDADSLFIGKQDVSTVAVNIFNENWKFFTKTLGSSIIDSALKIFYEYVTQFFEAVPAKDLIIGDLYQYVKN